MARLMTEPACVGKLRELLCIADPRLRLEAWKVALTHVWPIAKDGSDAGRVMVVFNNHVPRPEPRDVTPPR